MKSRVRVIDKGFERYIADMKKAVNGPHVAVGVQGEEASSTYDDGTTVIESAVYTEFGTKKSPERPWLRGGTDNNADGFYKLLAKLISSKKYPDRVRALQKAGKWFKGKLKQGIENFSAPRNAVSTVQAKGFNNPLIETRKLKESVTSELRR